MPLPVTKVRSRPTSRVRFRLRAPPKRDESLIRDWIVFGPRRLSSICPDAASTAARVVSIRYISTRAITASRVSIVSVSRLRLENTRSKTSSMYIDGTIIVRLSTRLASKASTDRGLNAGENSQRMQSFPSDSGLGWRLPLIGPPSYAPEQGSGACKAAVKSLNRRWRCGQG